MVASVGLVSMSVQVLVQERIQADVPLSTTERGTTGRSNATSDMIWCDQVLWAPAGG